MAQKLTIPEAAERVERMLRSQNLSQPEILEVLENLRTKMTGAPQTRAAGAKHSGGGDDE